MQMPDASFHSLPKPGLCTAHLHRLMKPICRPSFLPNTPRTTQASAAKPRRHQPIAAIVAGLLLALTPALALAAIRAVFPNDPSVLDVKRDFGAVGDGIADDTAALQRGLEASSDRRREGRGTAILSLPNGVYRVTDTLVVRSSVGPWVYGESRDGVVIRLADGAGTNVLSVLRTHPSDTQATSADFFMRNVRNLTIDVGRNPGVDGVRWYGNNSSLLKNVRVTGAGAVGVNAGFLGQNGPSLVQDVLVDGSFETGVRCAWSWGQTLSRVTIRNARKEGVQVNATAVGIEDLVVENTPIALRNEYPNDWTWWGGVVALVGGRFTGGDAAQPAITNRNVLYARDVTASGFADVLHSITSGGDVRGGRLEEYLSHPAKKLFPDSPDAALKMPILAEPEFAWETNTANWVCANDQGAKFGDNQDDTAAIQAAIDAAAAAGKTVVYLRGISGGDPNWYTLNGEVRVHGSVRHILGLGFGRIVASETGRFVVDDASAPVVKFQHIQAFGGRPPMVENQSKSRALIVESCDFRILGTGGGDIFATDCPSSVELRAPGQRLWARQLNPEGDSDLGLVRNHGGRLWALGVKHEGRGVRFLTDNGGQTEILGLFNYAPNIRRDDRRPAFDVDQAAFSAAGVREVSFGNTYPVKVRETRENQTLLEAGGGWIGWALYSGWTPQLTNGAVAVARPRLKPEGGEFLAPIKVSASTTTPGAQLRHTTDGAEPVADSPLLPDSLEIANSTALSVRAFREGLAPSAIATACFAWLVPREPVAGLAAREDFDFAYYHGEFMRLPDFATLAPVKTGRLAALELSPREREQNFAFRFQGVFIAAADGLYSFHLESDDGARLWLGDELVVDSDGLHGPEEKSAAVLLKAGAHPLTLGYFNAAGGHRLVVEVTPPGGKRQPLTATPK